MNFHIFTRRTSTGAGSLVRALEGLGHHATRGEVVPNGVDLVVNWGEGGIQWGAQTILNPHPTLNKHSQLRLLSEGNVACPRAFDTPTEGGVWLPRLNSHSEGRDIMKCLREEATADFWTEYTSTVHELRFHIFRGKSIRCGIKKPIHPAASHPYIRSYRNGWNMVYGESHIRAVNISEDLQVRCRQEAKLACEVLHLDFGAVDVGITMDLRPIVFEVNHAPGIEGRMTEIYAENIIRAASPTRRR